MLNNHGKTTQNFATPPMMVAGTRPSDHNIEFFGDVDPISNQQVTYWTRNGNTHRWADLPPAIYEECLNAFINDIPAVKYLSASFPNEGENRWVELFIYYNYGYQDFTPDVINGKLQPAENFRTTRDCPSLQWNSKWITTKDGQILTKREVDIIDFISDGLPDKVIADEVCLSVSHYDKVKRDIFTKFNVHSKAELMVATMRAHIVLEKE